MKNEVTSNIVDFILGGRAEFTIYQEPSTYVKYKVLGSKDGKLFRIFTNSGMEGDNSLRYQGYIFADSLCNVHKGKALDAYKNEKTLKGLLWVFRHSENMDSRVHVLHHCKCSVCSRKLTTPESINRGIGPKCWENRMTPVYSQMSMFA